jgi:hypothetical protein
VDDAGSPAGHTRKNERGDSEQKMRSHRGYRYPLTWLRSPRPKAAQLNQLGLRLTAGSAFESVDSSEPGDRKVGGLRRFWAQRPSSLQENVTVTRVWFGPSGR